MFACVSPANTSTDPLSASDNNYPESTASNLLGNADRTDPDTLVTAVATAEIAAYGDAIDRTDEVANFMVERAERLREIAENAASETLNDQRRATYNDAFVSIERELDATVSTSRIDGRPLTAPPGQTTLPPRYGAITLVAPTFDAGWAINAEAMWDVSTAAGGSCAYGDITRVMRKFHAADADIARAEQDMAFAAAVVGPAPVRPWCPADADTNRSLARALLAVQAAETAAAAVSQVAVELRALRRVAEMAALPGADSATLTAQSDEIVGRIGDIARTTAYDHVQIVDGSVYAWPGAMTAETETAGIIGMNIILPDLRPSAIHLDHVDLSDPDSAAMSIAGVDEAVWYIQFDAVRLDIARERLSGAIARLDERCADQ